MDVTLLAELFDIVVNTDLVISVHSPALLRSLLLVCQPRKRLRPFGS